MTTSKREAVATAYHLPASDLARWDDQLVDIFHRAAVNRGWLTPEETP